MAKIREALPWLIPFLGAKFYDKCSFHSYKQTRFCLMCLGSPFCGDCYRESINHTGHTVLKVNKFSDESVIKVESISKCLDITGIQQNKINTKRFVYILRKTSKPRRTSSRSFCISCGLDPHIDRTARFCSLQCAVKHELDLVVASMTTARENSGASCSTSTSVEKNELHLLDLNEPLVTEENDRTSVSAASEQTGNIQRKSELVLPDLNEPVPCEENIDSLYASTALGFGTDCKHVKKKKKHFSRDAFD